MPFAGAAEGRASNLHVCLFIGKHERRRNRHLRHSGKPLNLLRFNEREESVRGAAAQIRSGECRPALEIQSTLRPVEILV